MEDEDDVLNAATSAGIEEIDTPEDGDASQQVDDEIVNRAREMGWVPKEEWKGDPEAWTDADEYVRRGEEVLPIVRANNRRLAQQLQARDRELAETKRALEEMQESLQVIQGIQHRESVGRLDRAIKVTRTQLEEARAERDTDKAVELQEKLDELLAEKQELGEEPKAKPKGKARDPEGGEDTYEPPEHLKSEIAEWQEENDWFGTDKVRTRMMNAVAHEVRADPKFRKAVGKAFLDECARRVDEELAEAGVGTRRSVSKVSGGSQSGARQGTTRRGKSYADLPADAKRACDLDTQRVVGPNKAFKTKEDYQQWYVKEYFGGEA